MVEQGERCAVVGQQTSGDVDHPLVLLVGLDTSTERRGDKCRRGGRMGMWSPTETVSSKRI